ncbi:MAG: hypothetical protein IJ581_07820 [Paludibacteraceae bacterium]|nr:hypothetical protein [Paludibacteraceae bacterium]
MESGKMSYDAALARAEELVRELESTAALSASAYKERAGEVKRLLDYCEGMLLGMEQELSV